LTLLAAFSNGLFSQDAAPPKKTVKTTGMIYKAQPRRTLGVYFPDDWKESDKRPALVIFRCNIPEQREHFRKLGMVIIKPQLAPVNSGRLPGMSLEDIAAAAKPRNQVEDTKSAIRFIRANAGKLGIDPEKIVATGTSGGGDLALQSYINTAFEDPQDDRSISHQPNGLVLYCPAFDGVNIWFVKSENLLQRTKAEAPAFLPLLPKFVVDTSEEYAQPKDHRENLFKLAAELGQENKIEEKQVAAFVSILKLFNQRDWQLLHPADDALRMSATRLLTDKPLPPTLIMFGTRDHLHEHQTAFVAAAKAKGKAFELKIFQGAGHSFMMQPAFMEPSTAEAERFLREQGFLTK